jgi:phosphate starvation-inducible PhoH-like protein
MACKEGINQLNNGSYEKLLITRPAVSIDNEQHGYLPGTLNKKMDPWIRPIYDNIEDIIGIKQLEYLIKHKVIEICPFAYIRGRTFKNTYIIADEMQNSSRMQFKTLLTRIGESSKIVVNGDLLQSDNSSNDGLNDFITRLIEYSKNNERKYTKIVNLLNDDIQRHPSILEVLDIYS